ncbi:hypothetical protein DM860_001460 [Cuscuta australis]|uniref:Beta-amylase n=1 Tax=Cuscuta australis TaxID=267555 RepID=A0A328E8T8_9ASTE|nr:hypothetical protein DM860_001460 [Cuscuta australis]
MDASMIRCSQVLPGRSDLGSVHAVRVCAFNKASQQAKASSSSTMNSNLRLLQTLARPSSRSARLTIKAASAEPRVADRVCGTRRSSHIDTLKLYVGMPMDAVSDSGTVNHARAIAAGLKALKLLGVDGIELPIWWGFAEKEAMGKYDWTGYLAVAEMIHKLGMKLHVSFCFHASSSTEHKISLPDWVCRIGESDPSSIFYTDRSGRQYKDCLSLAVDDLPVLDGKTPLQVYQAFCESFKAAFSKFMGSTITGISIGLGPDGELRYPSHHHQASKSRKKLVGVGEFQCYDKNMLSHLKHHAEVIGNPLWGLGGPHDAPSYDELPSSSSFFKDHGGSWETAYGNFFLSWYSKQLIAHGDRLLSAAASTFRDSPITVSGKLPLIHYWFKTRSHPAELTAGIYNTVIRDGYEEMIEMFSRNGCSIVLPGMDLCDEQQPSESLSSPESLLAHIMSSCTKHRVEIMGQNSVASNATGSSFQQMKKNLLHEEEGAAAAISLLTYQRMGAHFFSPEHFPLFTNFIQNLREMGLDADDQPAAGKEEEQAAAGAGRFLSGRELQELAA